MERFNVIKDISIQLGLTQIQGSWIKTLGTYLGVAEEPGGDDYEQRVFTAAISNSDIVIPPLAIETQEDGVLFNPITEGINFTGAGVNLSSNVGDNIVNVEIIGGVNLTQDEGVDFQTNTVAYNFTGAGVNLVGGALPGYVDVNIPGGGGSSGRFGIADINGDYTYYLTLNDAITIATSGQVVEVFADYTEVDPTTVTLKDGVTINGNGHTYTSTDGTVNGFYGEDITCSILNYNMRFLNLQEVYINDASGFRIINSDVDFNGSTIYSEAESGQEYTNTLYLNGGSVSNLFLKAIGQFVMSINCIGSAIVNNTKVESEGFGIDGICIVRNCNVNSLGNAIASTEVYNSIGISNIEVGILATRIFDSYGKSINGIGVDGNFVYNTICYSINGPGAANGGSYRNCTIVSENGVAFRAAGITPLLENCTIKSLYDDLVGHAIYIVNLGTILTLVNCTLEVTNATAYCIHAANPETSNYANCTFVGSTTPISANITQGETKTVDIHGNVLPGGTVGGGGLPYKSYQARISQSGTDTAPTEDVVLYNDLGYNLVYEYAPLTPGVYWVHASTGDLGPDPSKIVCISGGSQLTGDAQGNFQTKNEVQSGQNWIRIETFEVPGFSSDDILNGKFIEIRVYP